ncbi:MAG: hypothetical protein NTV51_13810 [Verrucomicrobia bacterium]|nr:hypothetical protein [Verrucomicrobiota bacterium]
MRPSPLLIALSLAVNTALLGALTWRPSLAPPAFREFFSRSPSAESLAAEARARDLAAAQAAADSAARAAAANAQLWSALQSDDPRTLIARLRAAGFPPTVVRFAVDAQLTARLNARFRQHLRGVPERPYWKLDAFAGSPFTGPSLWLEYDKFYRAYSQQKREALTDDWLAGAGEASPEQRRRYGDLPKAKIDLIERINADYDEMSARVRESMQGIALIEDRKKFDLLNRERRADLAAALTPEELENYDMRNSSVAFGRTNALTLMDATEAEFRAIYFAQKTMDDRLRLERASTGDLSPATRTAAQDQFTQELRTALGEARYADYQRSSSGEFQQLHRLSQRENLPVDTALRAFALRDRVSAESTRIVNDPAQTSDQKRAALQVLAQNTRAQLLASLGSTVGPAYLETANRWLIPVERGNAVTFGFDNARKLQPIPGSPTP